MPLVLRETERTARKQHRCDVCGSIIEPGSGYSVAVLIYDGRPYDWKTCGPCRDDNITQQVWDWCGNPDEGVGYEDALEWARESPRDDDAIRFLERARETKD